MTRRAAACVKADAKTTVIVSNQWIEPIDLDYCDHLEGNRATSLMNDS